MTISDLKTALDGTGYDFAIYGFKNATSETYGVIAPDSAGSLWGDSKAQEQSVIGTVDLFTKDPTESPKDAVQEVLASLDISWYLNSVQYEEDTGYIHWEWVWEMV